MSALHLAVIVLAVVALAAWWAWRGRFGVDRARPVVSRFDGQAYRVHSAHGARQRAADLIAAINDRVVSVLRALRRRHAGAGGARGAAAARMLARYDPDSLVENSPRDPAGDTSYCIDKGAVLALCLRERDPAESGDPAVHDFHDLDTLTFVALHELAHMAVDEIDHTPGFWAAFRFVLEVAESEGVYTSPDFEAAPRRYCGMTIDYSPRWDDSVPRYP